MIREMITSRTNGPSPRGGTLTLDFDEPMPLSDDPTLRDDEDPLEPLPRSGTIGQRPSGNAACAPLVIAGSQWLSLARMSHAGSFAACGLAVRIFVCSRERTIGFVSQSRPP